MDPLVLLGIALGGLVAAVFNYLLNLAPGSTPEDFEVGEPPVRVSCDCALNPLIVSVIAVAVIAVSSPYFGSLTELYVVCIVLFVVVTCAGMVGRWRRHDEWRRMFALLDLVVRREELEDGFEYYDEDDDEE